MVSLNPIPKALSLAVSSCKLKQPLITMIVANIGHSICSGFQAVTNLLADPRLIVNDGV